jgi:hypothetical protein
MSLKSQLHGDTQSDGVRKRGLVRLFHCFYSFTRSQAMYRSLEQSTLHLCGQNLRMTEAK